MIFWEYWSIGVLASNGVLSCGDVYLAKEDPKMEYEMDFSGIAECGVPHSNNCGWSWLNGWCLA